MDEVSGGRYPQPTLSSPSADDFNYDLSGGRYPQPTLSSHSADDFNDDFNDISSKLKLCTEQLEIFINRRYDLQMKQRDLDQELRDFRKRQEEMKDLQNMRKELDEEVLKLGQECRPIDLSTIDLQREISLKDALIPFVCTIQDAQLYFQVKDYVIRKYKKFDHKLMPWQIADILLHDSELRTKFSTILDLHFRQVSNTMFFIQLPSKEDHVLSNPVYKLVHRFIETDYVMDEDPMVELRRIIESDPALYDLTFRSAGQPLGYLARQELKTEEDARKKYCELREPMVEKMKQKEKYASMRVIKMVENKGKYADVVRGMAAVEEKGKYGEGVRSMPVSNMSGEEKGNMVVEEKGKYADVVKGTPVSNMAVEGKEKYAVAVKAKMHGRRKKGKQAAEKGNMAVEEKGKHAEVVKGTSVTNMAAEEKGKCADHVVSLFEEEATFVEYSCGGFAKGAKIHGRRKK